MRQSKIFNMFNLICRKAYKTVMPMVFGGSSIVMLAGQSAQADEFQLKAAECSPLTTKNDVIKFPFSTESRGKPTEFECGNNWNYSKEGVFKGHSWATTTYKAGGITHPDRTEENEGRFLVVVRSVIKGAPRYSARSIAGSQMLNNWLPGASNYETQTMDGREKVVLGPYSAFATYVTRIADENTTRNRIVTTDRRGEEIDFAKPFTSRTGAIGFLTDKDNSGYRSFVLLITSPDILRQNATSGLTLEETLNELCAYKVDIKTVYGTNVDVNKQLEAIGKEHVGPAFKCGS